MDESGQYGCSTDRIYNPIIEFKFDRVYQITTIEVTTNKKYPDDQSRVRGVEIYVKEKESDSWKEIGYFKEGYLPHLNKELNVPAAFVKLQRCSTGEVSFGRILFRASDAPVNIKTKTGSIKDSFSKKYKDLKSIMPRLSLKTIHQ